jgi:hypothetical protein
VENKMTEVTQLSQTHLNKTTAVQDAHLDISRAPRIWSGVRFRSREDEISFGRWRLGFLVFYGVTALLLGGLAMAVDRPTTLASAAAPTHPAIDARH